MRHRSRGGARAAELACAIAIAALASAGSAQSVRDEVLTGNPSRTPGGSCLYDGEGRLIFGPRGANCPESEQPPAGIAPEPALAPVASAPPRAASRADSTNPSPELRAEAAALLAERERLDVHLARVREALGYEDREAARRVVDVALRAVTRHLEHEARVLQPLAAW